MMIKSKRGTTYQVRYHRSKVRVIRWGTWRMQDKTGAIKTIILVWLCVLVSGGYGSRPITKWRCILFTDRILFIVKDVLKITQDRQFWEPWPQDEELEHYCVGAPWQRMFLKLKLILLKHKILIRHKVVESFTQWDTEHLMKSCRQWWAVPVVQEVVRVPQPLQLQSPQQMLTVPPTQENPAGSLLVYM